jgi:hypothetical protein
MTMMASTQSVGTSAGLRDTRPHRCAGTRVNPNAATGLQRHAGGSTRRAASWRVLRGLESRRVYACGVQAHGGSLVEREIECAVVEVGAGGARGAVDVDTLGGWQRRVD